MSHTLSTFRSRLAQGADAAFGADLESAVKDRRQQRGGHGDWALLCEEAGLVQLAFSEFQLALRDDPADRAALFRLANYYRERGDHVRGLQQLEKLLDIDPAKIDWLIPYLDLLQEDNAQPRMREALDRAIAHGLTPEKAAVLMQNAQQTGPDHFAEEDSQAEDIELATITEADCIRFQNLFAGREDVYARQWASGSGGGYSPVQEPFTPAVVRNHLLGSVTVGVYPIRLDETCNFFAIDLDIDKSALEKARSNPDLARTLRDGVRQEGLRLRGVLRDLGFIPVLEDSGFKGRHLWVFLQQPESAKALHLLGRMLLNWQQSLLPAGLHLEFFPKQSENKVGKGLGNLIKLPLGIHRRTGRRALLLDGNGKPLGQPLSALRKVVRATRETLYAAIEKLKAQAVTLPSAASADQISESEENLSAKEENPPAPPGPPPPLTPLTWTEADFEADPRIKHLLGHCPVLVELKKNVEEHRRLTNDEQNVLIHTLGHVEGGPQAVNYLLRKCVDVGPEKYLKDRLKGSPTSCQKIRKNIGYITRLVDCNCPFDFAPDRYPTPVLHLLTLPVIENPIAPTPQAPELEHLARRYSAIVQRHQEITRELEELQKALVEALRVQPERTITCPGGKYRLIEEDGVEELKWQEE